MRKAGLWSNTSPAVLFSHGVCECNPLSLASFHNISRFLSNSCNVHMVCPPDASEKVMLKGVGTFGTFAVIDGWRFVARCSRSRPTNGHRPSCHVLTTCTCRLRAMPVVFSCPTATNWPRSFSLPMRVSSVQRRCGSTSKLARSLSRRTVNIAQHPGFTAITSPAAVLVAPASGVTKKRSWRC